MKNANVLVMISPMSPPRINGVVHYAREHGWRLTFSDRLARQAADWRGDGVLATVRAEGFTAECVKRFRRRGIPVVDLTVERPDLRLPRVVADHAGIGTAAARHFLERGFSHFAWFSTSWTHVHELRFGSFAKAIAAARKTSPLSWVLARDVPADKLDDGRHFERWLGSRLQAADKPLAICAYDDADAARVLSVCAAAGVAVPEEVAVLGVGNETMISEYQPTPISSVAQNLETSGYEGAKMLDRILDGKRPRPVVLPHGDIVVRQSTDTLSDDDPLLHRALLYVRGHLDRSFGIQQMAHDLNVPRRVLGKIFRRKRNRSFTAEVMHHRINKAKELLGQTNQPISEIAATCGFCNIGYLSNAFKDATGVSPREWRKRLAASRSA